jgi:hypothetical protein
LTHAWFVKAPLKAMKAVIASGRSPAYDAVALC